MTTRLEITINDSTAKILRWAEIEHGRSTQDVLAIGTYVLGLLTENIKEIYVVDAEGNETDVTNTEITDDLPDIYNF